MADLKFFLLRACNQLVSRKINGSYRDELRASFHLHIFIALIVRDGVSRNCVYQVRL